MQFSEDLALPLTHWKEFALARMPASGLCKKGRQEAAGLLGIGIYAKLCTFGNFLFLGSTELFLKSRSGSGLALNFSKNEKRVLGPGIVAVPQM